MEDIKIDDILASNCPKFLDPVYDCLPPCDCALIEKYSFLEFSVASGRYYFRDIVASMWLSLIENETIIVDFLRNNGEMADDEKIRHVAQNLWSQFSIREKSGDLVCVLLTAISIVTHKYGLELIPADQRF